MEAESAAGGQAPGSTSGERTCILHIGMHKTGSSSIQRTINANLPILQDRYGIGSHAQQVNHSTFASAMANSADEVRPLPVPGLDTPESMRRHALSALEMLKETLQTTRPQRFVLSGEGLSIMRADGVVRLREFLAPHFDRFQVVSYMREPISYANSAAVQRVKAGATFDWIVHETLVAQRILAIEPIGGSVLPAYQFRIEKFQEVFGRENVHCLHFARDSLRNGNVVDDFFWRFLGIDIADLPTIFAEENQSLDIGTVYALEYLNRTKPVFVNGRFNANRSFPLVQDLAGRKSKTRFSIPGFDYGLFAEITEPDVEWLRQTTGGAIDFSLEVPPPGEAPSADELLSVVNLINDLSVQRDRHALRMLFFREMWRLASDQTADTAELARLIDVCTDPAFLPNAAYNLQAAGLPALANQARERLSLLKQHTG